MREEILLWWGQAEKDFEAARKNYDIGEYYLVAFLCQQAVEKALKAAYIRKTRENPGPIHSIIALANAVGLPAAFFTTLRKLGVDFVATRYPDAATGLPYENYDQNIRKRDWLNRIGC
ncbi:MAG: HEPN domain-containing protein [Candidatus Micrarchaeota archaeon]